MVAVAVSSIALGAVVQSWSVRLRRDKEEELIFRAQQYVRAILAYRKEHGGQFPTRLEDLAKPGPRQLRYIRQLYKDPLAKDGKWGLLYLVPGGRAIVDVVVAQRAQQKKSEEWDNEWETAGGSAEGASGANPASAAGLQEGFIPIGGMGGTGGGGGGGQAGAGQNAPVAMPMGPVALPPIPTASDSGLDEEESVSEPPVGWPIVGVVSRAFGEGASASEGEEGTAHAERRNPAERTFKVYKGHDEVSEWQFHVFDFGAELPQAPTVGGTRGPANSGTLGPGHGGQGILRNFGPVGIGGPRTQPGLPGFGPRGEGGGRSFGPGSGGFGGLQQKTPPAGQQPGKGAQIPPDED